MITRALLLAAAVVARDCRPPLDLVFLVDGSYSNRDLLSAATGELAEVVAWLKDEYPGTKIAAVEFTDKPYANLGDSRNMCARTICPFLSPDDPAAIEECWASLTSDGGGDIPEDTLTGLIYSVQSPDLQWRTLNKKGKDTSGARLVVLLTDARAHESPDMAMLTIDKYAPREPEAYPGHMDTINFSDDCHLREYPTSDQAVAVLAKAKVNMTAIIGSGAGADDALAYWKAFSKQHMRQPADNMVVSSSSFAYISDAIKAVVTGYSDADCDAPTEAPNCEDQVTDECGNVIPAACQECGAAAEERRYEPVLKKRPSSLLYVN